MKIPKIVLVIAVSVIGAGTAAGAGTYYFVNKGKTRQIEEKKETITRLENDLKKYESSGTADTDTNSTSSDTESSSTAKSNSKSDSTAKSSAPAASDATAGWQTYTNRDIGYTVKYPQGWTLQETDKWEGDRHIRYITINNQDNSIHPISVHWGFVRNGTYLYSTDRTGIGAGEITEVSSTMPILGVSIKKTKLTFEGKIKEYFYTPRTQPSDYTWEASIATRDEVNNTATNNLADYSEVDMAEAILANVTLMF